MEFIPTNDVFHHLLLLLQIHKDKEYVLSLFKRKGFDISKKQLQQWSTKTGEYNVKYRPMPQRALEAFIDALYEEKLVVRAE